MNTLMTLAVILLVSWVAIWLVSRPFVLIWRYFFQQRDYDIVALQMIEDSYKHQSQSQSQKVEEDSYTTLDTTLDYLINPNMIDSFDVFHETSATSSGFGRDEIH